MDETDLLNDSDDKFADGYSSSQMEMCSQCNLPRMVVSYEVGFRLLQQQLIELRKDLQQLVNKIDALEHNRNI